MINSCDSDPRTGTLALIFELMDMNIYELIKGRYPYALDMSLMLTHRSSFLPVRIKSEIVHVAANEIIASYA